MPAFSLDVFVHGNEPRPQPSVVLDEREEAASAHTSVTHGRGGSCTLAKALLIQAETETLQHSKTDPSEPGRELA